MELKILIFNNIYIYIYLFLLQFNFSTIFNQSEVTQNYLGSKQTKEKSRIQSGNTEVGFADQ